MGCGCRKRKPANTTQVPTQINLSQSQIERMKQRKEQREKQKLAIMNSTAESKRLSICSVCEAKGADPNHNVYCTKCNLTILDISKNKSFVCPMQKFVAYG